VQGLFTPRFCGTASWHSLPASSEGGNGSSHFRIFNRKGSSASLQRGNASRIFVPASNPSGKTRRNFRDDGSQGGNASLHRLPTSSHCRNSSSSRGKIAGTGLCQRAGVSLCSPRRSLALRLPPQPGDAKPANRIPARARECPFGRAPRACAGRAPSRRVARRQSPRVWRTRRAVLRLVDRADQGTIRADTDASRSSSITESSAMQAPPLTVVSPARRRNGCYSSG
jgi:hypothetical protein